MFNRQVASKIQHYRLLNVLGEGGGGIVYLAEDTRLQRKVAVKCLKPDTESAERSAQLKRLRREAVIMARLNHPNIVQVYDVVEGIFEGENRFALVIEYIDGHTLNKHIREHIVGLRQRLLCLLQIAEGLGAAHDIGLIHRDLKADNILINRQNTAKITDFGIAKCMWGKQTEYTQTGGLVGSYNALSPEQALGRPLDARSDLFSFGILAFELLCGRHPFGSTENPNVLVQNILHGLPLPARELNPGLGDAVVELLNHLLEKNPHQRPHSTDLVVQKLQQSISEIAPGNNDISYSETLDVDISRYAVERSYGKGAGYLQKPESPAMTSSSASARKARRIVWIGLPIFLVLCLSGYWLWQKGVEPPYVAVLPTTINSDSTMPKQQQRLLLDIFDVEIQQKVLQSDSLHLVSSRDIGSVKMDYHDIAKAFAADVLIEALLDCEQQRCAVNIRKIVPDKKDGVSEPGRGVIKQQEHWLVLMDDQYRNLVTDLRMRLSKLFPEVEFAANEPVLDMSEKDYRWFMGIRYDIFKAGQETHENWQALIAVSERFKSYPPYYELLSYISLVRFDDTLDSSYLAALERQLQQAENSLGLNYSIVRNRLEMALREQRFDDARKLLDQIPAFNADEVVYLKQSALNQHYQGHYTKADELYQKALALRPSVALFFDAAFNQWYSGESKAAIASLEQLLSLSPDDFNARVLLASIQLTLGETESAITQYKKILEVSQEARHFNNLGLAYALQQDYAQAQSAFTEAVKRSPRHAHMLLNLADSYKLNGQEETAQRYYREALALAGTGKDMELLVVAAQANIHLGNTNAAIRMVHESLKSGEDNPLVLFNAALINTLARQWSTALVYTEKSLDQGLSAVWFELSWFDDLCRASKTATTKILGSQRCSSIH